MARYALLFLGIQLLVVLLVTYLAGITLWLPGLVYFHG
jgi:TRAP-type C4-dicarboxylate transport system permease large subunit